MDSTQMDAVIDNLIETVMPKLDDLLASMKRQSIAKTLEALMASAHHAHDVDEGRLREDFLVLARQQLAMIGADGIGTRRDEDDDGPRTVFDGDKMIAPNGTEWSIG